MKLKRVNLNDLDKIMKMEKQIFKSDSFSRDTLKKLINQNSLFLKLVNCQDKEKILGFIIAIQDEIHRINIINLLIKKKYQNKGFGSLLLGKTLERIKNLNKIKKIVLNVKTKNKIAIKLYQKFKFRIVQEIENYYRNQQSAYLMELEL